MDRPHNIDEVPRIAPGGAGKGAAKRFTEILARAHLFDIKAPGLHNTFIALSFAFGVPDHADFNGLTANRVFGKDLDQSGDLIARGETHGPFIPFDANTNGALKVFHWVRVSGSRSIR